MSSPTIDIYKWLELEDEDGNVRSSEEVGGFSTSHDGLCGIRLIDEYSEKFEVVFPDGKGSFTSRIV